MPAIIIIYRDILATLWVHKVRVLSTSAVPKVDSIWVAMNYIMLASRKPCGIKLDGLIPIATTTGVIWVGFLGILSLRSGENPLLTMTVDVFCIGNVSWNSGVYFWSATWGQREWSGREPQDPLWKSVQSLDWKRTPFVAGWSYNVPKFCRKWLGAVGDFTPLTRLTLEHPDLLGGVCFHPGSGWACEGMTTS